MAQKTEKKKKVERLVARSIPEIEEPSAEGKYKREFITVNSGSHYLLTLSWRVRKDEK